MSQETERDLENSLPGIVSFTQQEAQVTDLIKQVKSKLDPDGQALLLHLLKKFSRFVVNSQR